MGKLISNNKILIILFIIGFILRLYLSSLGFGEVIYDTASYHRMAREILHGKLTADCCDHNPGYSVFLAGVYGLFGSENILALRIVQVLLDLITGVLIYLTAKSLFGVRTATFGLGLYMINPFTSSYTGLRLSEILALFLVSVIAFFLSRKDYSNNVKWWMPTGVALGLFLLVKQSTQFLIYIFLFSCSILVFKKMKRFFLYFVIIGFLIGSTYSLLSNWHNFRKISVVPPYSVNQGILYWNFYNDRYPELLSELDKVNPVFWDLQLELHRTYYTNIPEYRKKYFNLFLQKMRSDWPVYIRNITRNMTWIWDKNHLAYYTDPFYPQDSRPLQIINFLSLALSFFGLGVYILREKLNAIRNPLFLFTIIIYLTITFIFTLASNETRHSLFAYSLVYLWAGFGVDWVIHGCGSIIYKNLFRAHSKITLTFWIRHKGPQS